MMRQPRVKDPAHLEYVRAMPCCICHDDVTVEAAHVRFACEAAGKRHTGMGEKPDDRWTVPLCGEHHRDQHAMNEREFWDNAGIDPIHVARGLYAFSGDHENGERFIVRLRQAA